LHQVDSILVCTVEKGHTKFCNVGYNDSSVILRNLGNDYTIVSLEINSKICKNSRIYKIGLEFTIPSIL